MTTDEAGGGNYAADRAAVDAVLKVAPELGFTARANRAFLGRVGYVDYDPAVLAHARASELLDTEVKQGFDDIVSRRAQQQYISRSREQMARFFTGMDLVESGLVRVEEWRPAPGAGATPSGRARRPVSGRVASMRGEVSCLLCRSCPAGPAGPSRSALSSLPAR